MAGRLVAPQGVQDGQVGRAGDVRNQKYLNVDVQRATNGRWSADAVGLKHHLAHAQASWLEAKLAAQHLLQAFRRNIVLPCRYCHQSRVSKDRHYFQCPTLSICAYLQVWHDNLHPGPHGSRHGGGQIFRKGRSGGDAAHQAAPAGSITFDLSDDQGKRQRQERERERQRKANSPTTDLGLRQWFRKLGKNPWPLQTASQQQDYIGDADYYIPAACAEPHTTIVLHQEQTLASMHQDVTLYLDSTSLSKRGRAASSRCSIRQPRNGGGRKSPHRELGNPDLLFEDRDVQTIDDRVARPPDRSCEDLGRAGEGPAAQLGERTGSLESIEMRSPQAGAAQDHGAHRRPAQAGRGTAEGSQRGGSPWVSELQKDDGSTDHRLDAIPPGTFIAPSRRSPSCVALAGASAPMALLTKCTREAGEFRCGTQPIGLVLKLNLRNTGNMCYINTTILSTAWSVLQLQRHGTESLTLHSCYHALVSGSTPPQPVQVAQLMQWRLLLGKWPQIGRQHDICEFLNYLVPRIRWSIDPLNLRWEARRFCQDQLCGLDSGTAYLPIPVPLCSGEMCHWQWCVGKWHAI